MAAFEGKAFNEKKVIYMEIRTICKSQIELRLNLDIY